LSQITLESGFAKATILPERGALLNQLTLVDRKGQPRDVLWAPEDLTSHTPDTWPGGGLPFLFPFAGRVWHNGNALFYQVGNHEFPMPLHGFSWALSWELTHKTNHTARFVLRSTEATKKTHYPFDFEIMMQMTLAPNSLHVAVDILYNTLAAKTREKMPVAIGWHPYFVAAGCLRAKIAAETIYPVTSNGNAGDPQSARSFLGDGPWTMPQPKLHSLIFGELSSEAIILNYEAHTLAISSGPEDVMQHLVTWTNKPDKFLCIEPWMSLPDAVARPSGCRWLKPGEKLAAWLNLECR
jgi:galactose mutarotase-like enzyme